MKVVKNQSCAELEDNALRCQILVVGGSEKLVSRHEVLIAVINSEPFPVIHFSEFEIIHLLVLWKITKFPVLSDPLRNSSILSRLQLSKPFFSLSQL